MEKQHLTVLWTSGDKKVAKGMVFMYTFNAKKLAWWKNITFIIWGASSELLSNDKELQEQLKEMKNIGIDIYACKACAKMLGVVEKLENLGVNVDYMGEPLTKYLKDENTEVITF